MFGIDEGAGAAGFLGFRNDVQRDGRLARAFRAIDFDNAAPRQAADAERDVEAQRAGGNHISFNRLLPRAEFHDRAFAEGPFDLAEGGFQCLVAIHGILVDQS